MFRSVCRHELETRLSHKPWKQEIAKIPDWPRRKAVAEFWLCVGHDCLGYTSSPHWNPPWPLLHAMQPPRTHGQKPHRTMYRTEWAILGGQDKNDGVLTLSFLLLLFLWLLTVRTFIFTFNVFSICTVILTFYFYWSHRSMINSQCTCH